MAEKTAKDGPIVESSAEVNAKWMNSHRHRPRTIWTSWKFWTPILTLVAIIVVFTPHTWSDDRRSIAETYAPGYSVDQLFQPHDPYAHIHPIEALHVQADEAFAYLESNITAADEATISQAAQAYRDRRGRHPPPHFDEWIAFAKSVNSTIYEPFFDQIHHDLEPFWALSPAAIRAASHTWPVLISIRKGALSVKTETFQPWLRNWIEGLGVIFPFLPDLDFAINTMDDPKVMINRKVLNELMEKAFETRNVPTDLVKVFRTEYSEYEPAPEKMPDDDVHNSIYVYKHDSGPFWQSAREACAEDSPAHNAILEKDTTRPPQFTSEASVSDKYRGYVSNWTTSKSVCDNAELRNLHGSMMTPEPVWADRLFPLFSGCKAQGIHNDILLPPAMYFSDSETFSGGGFDSSLSWNERNDFAMWRGSATGGNHNPENWTRMQRLRFVAMLNASLVERHIQANFTGQSLPEHVPSDLPWNFPLPQRPTSRFDGGSTGGLGLLESSPTDGNGEEEPFGGIKAFGEWLANITDAGLTHMMCDPWQVSVFTPGRECNYLEPWYHWVESVPLREQFHNKFVPDVDGFSYSGRYRAFLRSGSMPIKATIFTEWHDQRLMPWKHFVPMDNTFRDWWGILDYFMGLKEERKEGFKIVAEATAAAEAAAARNRTMGSNHTRIDEPSRGSNLSEAATVDTNAHGKDLPGRLAARAKSGKKPQEEEPAKEWVLTDDMKQGMLRDSIAQDIAETGRYWAGKMLRKEDMQVYTYRLLLEYARTVDDNRLWLGFVDDLMGHERNLTATA